MKSMLRLILCSWFLFASIAVDNVYAVESLPKNLINFAGEQGFNIFKKNMNVNSLKLLAHFTTQETVTYCGVASMVMILNSSSISPPADNQHFPYYYFTQDNFFNAQVEKIISQADVSKKGITLAQLGKMMNIYGLKTKVYYANQVNLIKFRRVLKEAVSNKQFVIVNFLRSGLQEKGGGHHSPLAAYDAQTDRFLLLDVARYKYPAYWIRTEDLWKAVNTMDGDEYRGFVVVDN